MFNRTEKNENLIFFETRFSADEIRDLAGVADVLLWISKYRRGREKEIHDRSLFPRAHHPTIRHKTNQNHLANF